MFGLFLMQVGIISLSQVELALMPQNATAGISVITRYPGTDPETIERQITMPLERAINNLIGLDYLLSESREGESRVHIIFSPGEPMAIRTNQANEQVQLVAGSFPREVNRPYIIEYSAEDQPIFAFSISSNQLSLPDLRTFVDANIKKRFSGISGVSEVLVTGGNPREIQVIIDPEMIASKSIEPQSFSRLLSNSNNSQLIGNIAQSKNSIINFDAAIQSLNDLDRIPYSNGKASISDWSVVRDGFRELEDISRTNGEKRISVYIKKNASSSILAVTDELIREFESIRFPTHIKSQIIINHGDVVRSSLTRLIIACLQSILITGIVMFAFIPRISVTLCTAFSIPYSILCSFSIMKSMDVTLHALTLSALAMSAGLIIDNAIVITERTDRLNKEGKTSFQDKVSVLHHSIPELVAGTLTTVITFLPLMFMDASVNNTYRDFVITVCCVLLFSLFYAVVLLPNLLPKQSNRSSLAPISKKISELIRFNKIKDKILPPLQNLQNHHIVIHQYNYILVFSLVIVTGLLIFLLIKTPVISSSFSVDSSIHGKVSMETGLHLDRSAEIFEQLEEKALENSFVSKVEAKIQKNQGDLYMTLIEDAQTNHGRELAIESLRDTFRSIPEAYVHIENASEQKVDYAIKISFLGNDYKKLKKIIENFAKAVQKEHGVTGIIYHFREPRQYLNFKPDPDIWKENGPAPAEIAAALKIYMTGIVVSKLHWQNDELDLRLKGKWNARDGVNALSTFPFAFRKGYSELKNFGEFYEEPGEAAIWRENKRRSLSISVQMDVPVHHEIIEYTYNYFQNNVNDPDINFLVDRQYTTDQEQGSIFIFSIIGAILLIYFILGGVFESLIKPLIVILSIPIPLLFALSVYFIYDETLSKVALFSLMMLSGLIANGAILMISTLSDHLENQNFPDELAYIQKLTNAVRLRIRPIMITGLTTIIGMIPILLASGAGSALWKPVAIISISGILVSIPVVIFLTPVLYRLLVSDSLANKY